MANARAHFEMLTSTGMTVWLQGDRTSSIEEVPMADLTEEQRKSYWRYNIRLTTILLVIWFVVTYLISGLWAGWLNQFSFIGFPLGYYMAAQGSLAIFVIEIAVYAYLMNKLDTEYGIDEGGET
jgi:putative solute:sodium symporter small subunit